MARTFGAVYLRVWRDQDWRTLSHTEQYLYWTLVFQPKLNRAGLLEYSPRRWAEGNSSLTVADVEQAIKNLEHRRYVVLDESTNELLVRTYVRNDEAWKQPKVMASVVSAANEIESPKLRYALLLELDRIPVEELADSPGPNNGPSIRAKIEKCIAQLRAILGGGDPHDPRGARPLAGLQASGFRYPTDTPEVPDVNDTGAHADTRPVATSQRPAPTPAPEPAPEPVVTPDREAAPLALFDAAPPARATEEPGAAQETDHNAHTLLGEWLAHRAKNGGADCRPPDAIIGRVGKQLKTLLAQGTSYEILRQAFAEWDRKGADPSAIPSFVNQIQGRRAATRSQALTSEAGSNVVSFQDFASRQQAPGQRVSATARAIAEADAAGEEAKRIIYGGAG